ncbi:hypothetical protein BpHYR1_012199 [Brachionus plicatilis]|uniref:Uncharacterized protein n=1 Tax=Brachionus plicatilis TaxID=10195 RepID=A0A3M7REN5_BRAPC|nr:hypothetical protein BpHYR1_012199 [Brachionus plicatilis]
MVVLIVHRSQTQQDDKDHIFSEHEDHIVDKTPYFFVFAYYVKKAITKNYISMRFKLAIKVQQRIIFVQFVFEFHNTKVGPIRQRFNIIKNFQYRKPLPSILGINLKFNRNSIWNSSHRNHVKNLYCLQQAVDEAEYFELKPGVGAEIEVGYLN